MNKKKIAILVSSITVASLALAVAIPFSIVGIRSKIMDNDYSRLFTERKITPKKLDVPLTKQAISCGYAIIEMLSTYYGDTVTEQELYSRNGNAITTASTDGFVQEINKTIPSLRYVAKSYVKNDEMLLLVHDALMQESPVAVEWAAKLDGEWTLHWSVVTGMDLEKIYINNPYGYPEEITYTEFISRTTFRAFERMPIGYRFGFAYGLFSKNTLIVPEK